jgi:chromosomal replication initiator protein
MKYIDKSASVYDNKEEYGKYLWDVVMSNVRDIIKAEQFDAWFQKVEFQKLENGTIVIAVKNNFIREWIINNYFLLIKKELSKIDATIKKISITVCNIDNKISELSPTNSTFLSNDGIFSKLNPKFVFENYIVGDGNFLAYKICFDIASKKITYNHNNIYYVHSPVGMGKTHLLQSIANQTRSNNMYNQVGYLSAEKFMHNFVNAVKNNNLFELRSVVNNTDIFLIDDIQFICGKESTQKEFSLILNSLIELGKVVVIASSLPPYSLELTDMRTKSLLISSNTVHINNLDYSLRVKILEFYNNKNDIKLGEDIIKLIAEKITSNVRELEASLNNLTTYLTISGREPSLNNIFLYIKNYMKSSNKDITMEAIINVVSKFYRLSKSDILSKKRTQKLVCARQVIAYISKEVTSLSLKTIGEKLGNRDHSTILYYLGRYNEQKNKNPDLNNDVEVIRNSLVG